MSNAVRTALLLLLLSGVAGSAILAGGTAEPLLTEARMAHPAANMPHLILGVYRYDAGSDKPVGAPAVEFSSDDDVVAQVGWRALDASTVASAEWYDSSGDLIDSVGPAPVRTLGSDVVMPAADNNGQGQYLLAIIRWVDGTRVETISRQLVQLS